MPKHKVLIDSSVWIEYFRSGEIPVLDRLIEEDLACTNELILTELVPVLAHQRRHDIVEGLEALEVIPLNINLNINWEILRKYQILKLRNGVNKVGIPDLI